MSASLPVKRTNTTTRLFSFCAMKTKLKQTR
ncbi:hypothetical protein LINPERPRIM_LOCUS30143, partial [Linum perenne]